MVKRYSEVLRQEIDITESSVICADGTTYNYNELDKIKNLDKEHKKTLHLLKKHFNGEIE